MYDFAIKISRHICTSTKYKKLFFRAYTIFVVFDIVFSVESSRLTGHVANGSSHLPLVNFYEH